MSGTLYIVATPIGNLEDITLRAQNTLLKADFIAAEDTRVTLKLLNYLNIKAPLISYHEHNAVQRGADILERISKGESCALCSDAGTPAISDPGQLLVADALAMGITVVPVPGASAVVTALSACGLATGRFCFEGFLPQNRRARKERLQQLQAEERTMVFYEAPHKLRTSLEDLCEYFGGERPMSVCRELTKLHEEIFVTTLSEALQRYTQSTPRGEFVLVVAGCPPQAQDTPAMSIEQAAELAQRLAQEQNLSASVAAKQAAASSGHSKSEVYRAMVAK